MLELGFVRLICTDFDMYTGRTTGYMVRIILNRVLNVVSLWNMIEPT